MIVPLTDPFRCQCSPENTPCMARATGEDMLCDACREVKSGDGLRCAVFFYNGTRQNYAHVPCPEILPPEISNWYAEVAE